MIPVQGGGDSPFAEARQDSRLLQRLRQGDEGALDLLLDRLWDPVVRYAASLLDGEEGEEGAEDLAQEAFLRLWDRRGEWPPDTVIRALLLTMVRNAALNVRRHREVRDRLAPDIRSLAGTPAPGPEEDLRAERIRSALDVALRALPPRQREVFVLARSHRMAYEEIAEVMGISRQTVANQMSMALRRVRFALGPLLEPPAPAPAHPYRPTGDAARRPIP